MVMGMERGRGDLNTSEAGVFKVGPLINPLLVCMGVCVSDDTLGISGFGWVFGEIPSRVAARSGTKLPSLGSA
jgi:hypothetical protein